jgi:hypothetical protein
VDRCALFVDAGYVLADGAMAVHGTRRRESVSWDYEGLLQLLASLATERSGLPLLRCYWYEATVAGRRSEEHEALADIPGVKLRIAKMRPGRREGVEGEIHRDLETLARNKAVSDAIVVSAEEDLAPVVAEVQDLGLRVTLLHIATDGEWTISRALRQECDDMVEISSEHLRPHVELISGAEPPRADEQEGASLIALRSAANGHGQVARTAAYAPAPNGSDILQSPGEPAMPDPLARPGLLPDDRPAAPPVPAASVASVASVAAAASAAVESLPVAADVARQDQPQPQPQLQPAARQDLDPGSWEPWRQQMPGQELYAAPVALPVPAVEQPMDRPADIPADLPAARTRQMADLSGYAPGAAREQLPADPASRDRFSRESLPGEPTVQPVAAVPATAQIHRLPTRGGGPASQPPGQPPSGPMSQAQPTFSATTAAQPAITQSTAAPVTPLNPAPGYGRNGSYSGPQPVAPSGPQPAVPVGLPVGLPPSPAGLASGPGGQPDGIGIGIGQGGPGGALYPTGQSAMGSGPAPQAGPVVYPGGQPSVSLAEAVQSAHDEGQEFGTSVARDAPALWLEAVLARKPRMPSDLEARLLQGSALPIDFLLHDEVRHALRRGFWDALERSRR